ncbi:acyl-CoA thioesterase [Rubrivirga sp. IMCC45206]|uniref:acyl-CoA thioesterase n=1 Tax=Rubrivirga sp. IMCC45206 TaxID=3391614 RepID=UPI00398FFDA7
MPDPLFTARIPVRWGDQDALGHVNNAAYLTYFEQARIEWLRSLADDAGDWPGAPTSGPILAAADLQFKRPIHYPATVVVTMTARPPGRTSAGVDAEIRVDGDDETVYATAGTTLVWVDYASGRPTPLPDALRARLS